MNGDPQKRHWFRPWWLLLLLPLGLGVARLRFDSEVLSLLPQQLPVVAGLQTYQSKLSGSRELILTVSADTSELADDAARRIAARLRADAGNIAGVVWQPPWREKPEQMAELIGHLWLNRPPREFADFASTLELERVPGLLAAAKEELATTFSPQEVARLSYDPLGFTRLPEGVPGLGQTFGSEDQLFSSINGTFRMLWVRAKPDLASYRECIQWLDAVKAAAASVAGSGVKLGYTGRPAFVADISSSMRHDIRVSVGGTAVIIAALFWLAHRRWRPMLWLLALLGIVLAGTLAVGGLLYGAINVVSMGFAAILLGLAVDYAVVHYQEAIAHPRLSIPQIRRAIAPSIWWAAITTIAAFLMLNAGGLPGLGQLGTLVAVGITLSAVVMVFAFLPPLFPARMQPGTAEEPADEPDRSLDRSCGPCAMSFGRALLLSLGLVAVCLGILAGGLPSVDGSGDALRPRDSSAYAAMDELKRQLTREREPLWLVISGQDEQQVADRLEQSRVVIEAAVKNGVLASVNLPSALVPNPQYQQANRGTAQRIMEREAGIREAVLGAGFSDEVLKLLRGVFGAWRQASESSPGVAYWPKNEVCSWILEKVARKDASGCYTVGFLFPPARGADAAQLRSLQSRLPAEGAFLTGWELMGSELLVLIRSNYPRIMLPMLLLVAASLWFAFGRAAEILLSAGVLLLSGVVVLAVMRMMGWSWNLLNLMAIPLILGTGVDYSLFMQLALRRHHGNHGVTYQSVGRALLLCGGTAVAGFAGLGLSSNAGMASLGQVCAVGIGANMVLAIYLLPPWWSLLARNNPIEREAHLPSIFYSGALWRIALGAVRFLPAAVVHGVAVVGAQAYSMFARRRRGVVINNLLPVCGGDHRLAERAASRLFRQFATKLVDLWRFEAGFDPVGSMGTWSGWEHIEAVRKHGRGVLLVTVHLGNWEIGSGLFAAKGVPLTVLTLKEPDDKLLQLRKSARMKRNIDTLVVGENPFAFVEIIKRLQAGGIVAMLVDRPPVSSGVEVELFGRPFRASVAAAELARASGCAVVPGIIVRRAAGFDAGLLPEIPYDRAWIGKRASRIDMTRQIMRAFEPAIRQDPDQWFHFVPIWPPRPERATPPSEAEHR